VFRFSSGIGIAIVTSLVFGVGATPASASQIEPDNPHLVVVNGIVDPEMEPVATFKAGQGATLTQIEDPAGVSGSALVTLGADRFEPIVVNAEVDGQSVTEEFDVEDFVALGEDDFIALLRATSSGETLQIDTTVVQQQALPVLLILGALARLGIKYAIRWYGKNQVKKAVKSYLLNNISASKWAHIMAPKHNWSAVGARSREQVAELIGRAMAEGKHIPYGTSGSSMMARWQHAGRTIEVTYAKNGGKVSNGWVVG
jgi:hypothetical protein